jgi:hypothetical protein
MSPYQNKTTLCMRISFCIPLANDSGFEVHFGNFLWTRNGMSFPGPVYLPGYGGEKRS